MQNPKPIEGPKGPRAYTLTEAGEALRIDRATIYRAAARGQIKLIKIAGRTLVPGTEVDRLAEDGTG